MIVGENKRFARSVGNTQHWNMFRTYYLSTLHFEIIKHLKAIYSIEIMNSSEVSIVIFEKLAKENPILIYEINKIDALRLIGMFIWNYLATIEGMWKVEEGTKNSYGHSGKIYIKIDR